MAWQLNAAGTSDSGLGLYPMPGTGVFMRREPVGLLLVGKRGRYELIPDDLEEVLERADGTSSLYELARSAGRAPEEVASKVLWLSSLAEQGFLELRRYPSAQARGLRVSAYRPFSDDAFSSPMYASLAITSVCNRDCAHCFRKGAERCRELDTTTLIGIIRGLSDLRLVELNITGGEPTLHRDFAEIIAAACGVIAGVSLSTNGTLLFPDRVDALLSAGVHCVQIGLNALFDDRSGSDEGMERIVEGARALLEGGAEVTLAAVLTRSIIDDLDEVERLGEMIRPAQLRIGPLIGCHEGVRMCMPERERMRDAILELRRWSRRT
ncbi:radical SAM protein, partial [Candidatus Fermentibacterales bacterium]|nr:radical SAM protein [Candidatus Fermentibacterales bacterium]